ncbi:OprO/OprP family phosphate-selective porin [Myxococcota bacterium]
MGEDEAHARADPERLTLSSADGSIELAFEPLVHVQARIFLAPEQDQTSTFLVRRARPTVRAKLFEHFELVLEPELARGTPTLLRAHAAFSWADWLRLRAGLGKVPIGLEVLQSAGATVFAELGLTSQMVPHYDVGVQLEGTVLDGFLSYAVGVHNGAVLGGAGQLDPNDSKDGVVRLFLLPFRPLGVVAVSELGLGLAASLGNQAGDLPVFRTDSEQVVFRYLQAEPETRPEGVVARGRRVILAPQGYYYYGPVGLLGEYVETEQRVSLDGIEDSVLARAWQVVGSVVLGGSPSYDGVEITHAFDWRRGRWGALELAARYHQLRVDDTAFRHDLADPSEAAIGAESWTVGLHWYSAPFIGWKLDLSRTRFDWDSRVRTRPTETVLTAQVGVAAW